MARKDVVKFICDHCNEFVEDEMCCEEPAHGYPKGWSVVAATYANGTSDSGNKWHDLCPKCTESWNSRLVDFFGSSAFKEEEE